MSSTQRLVATPSPAFSLGGRSQDSDDAEKGLYDHTYSLPVIPPSARVDQKSDIHLDTLDKRTAIHIETILSPISSIHEGITPFSSVTALSLSWPGGKPPNSAADDAAKKAARSKPKISRWVLFRLWFNTYRKFFTCVTLFNLTLLILTACGRFSYAENHLGALVLGNLLCAILMRNELFLRILYIICIYGLRSVRSLHSLYYHSHDGHLPAFH